MTNAVNLASAAGTGFAFRNRIINGDMRIDQRNAGASVTPATNNYVLDRWVFDLSQSSKFSVQQSAVVTPGFTNSCAITSLSAYSIAAGDFFLMRQSIEGLNVYDLAWGSASANTVTLSFWVRSSLTGTFGGSIRNSADNRSYVFSYTIISANAWEYKTISIPGDTSGTWLTTNGVGLKLSFSLGTGSTYSTTAGSWVAGNFVAPTGATSVVGTNGATFYLTGVQLEVGSIATPFERRLYPQELALCQRYFQNYLQPPLRGVMNTPSLANRCAMVLPVEMRATPTATAGSFNVYDGSGIGTVSSVATAYLNSKSVEFDFITSSFSAQYRPVIIFQNGSSSSLLLTAEL